MTSEDLVRNKTSSTHVAARWRDSDRSAVSILRGALVFPLGRVQQSTSRPRGPARSAHRDRSHFPPPPRASISFSKRMGAGFSFMSRRFRRRVFGIATFSTFLTTGCILVVPKLDRTSSACPKTRSLPRSPEARGFHAAALFPFQPVRRTNPERHRLCTNRLFPTSTVSRRWC